MVELKVGMSRMVGAVGSSRSRRLVVAVLWAVAAAACGTDADRSTSPTTESTTGVAPSTTTPPAPTYISNVRGELVVRFRGADEQRSAFLLTERGDLSLRAVGSRDDLVYESASNLARSYSAGDSGTYANEESSLAPGPPDRSGTGEWRGGYLLHRELGWVVRALAAVGDRAVAEITYEGRPAWHYQSDVVPVQLSVDVPDHLDVVVDRQTGLPLRVIGTEHGAFLSERRIEKLVVDGPVDPAELRFGFPSGAQVTRDDFGFRRVRLDEVNGIAGYSPLVPDFVPAGFELTEVMVAPPNGPPCAPSAEGSKATPPACRSDRTRPQPTGAEALNPVAGAAVSLAYRRGLDELVVTTRPVGPYRSLWSDPFGGEGLELHSEDVTVEGGALDGVKAELVIDPQSIPHLWGLSERLAVTVSGALSRSELLAVTGSLESRTRRDAP